MSDDATPKTDLIEKFLIEKFGENGLIEATGTGSLDLQLCFTRQLAETLWLPKGLSEEVIDARLQAGLAALTEIRPRNAMEGALAVQVDAHP